MRRCGVYGSALADESGSRILFDRGHNQRFLIEQTGELQLSALAEVIRVQGG